MEKGVFTSNQSPTSAKIDGTESFKKYCAGHGLDAPAITVGDMKTKLFLLKTNVLKFTQQKLNAKTKETNVLLNFLQMFNARALGYTAHIETVFHFLPKSNKHIGIDGYQGLRCFLTTRQTVVEDI